MARFLFTMLAANDLGLPTRLVPIARALADRGHEVAVFNPAPAPSKLIAEAGLKNLTSSLPVPVPTVDLVEVSSTWDVEHMFAAFCADEDYVRGMTAVYIELMRGYAPDVVVDSFDLLACIAARALHLKLATVLQGNFHPASRGFLWWEPERPAALPSAAAVVNKVAADYGLAPEPRCVDRLAGDLCLIVGTPETDPLPSTADVVYIGPIIWQRGDGALPEWVAEVSWQRPLIWVYSGNPRYAPGAPTPIDSIVVIRAAIAALSDSAMQVVLTTGFQELPPEVGRLPSNFHHAAYVPGPAMARHCDLMVHHGGHGSVMTSLMAGTPAVIIPTITERESNARRLSALGAGEVVMPTSGTDGEKMIDVAEFRAKVRRVLEHPSYRNSAQQIAESMRKYGGIQEAANRIERFATASLSDRMPALGRGV